MVRAFDPEPISPSRLDELLDQARRAPAAGNTQAVEFLVLDTPDATARYWQTTFDEAGRVRFRWQGLFDAPALVIITTRPDAYLERYSEPDKGREHLGSSQDSWTVPFWWVDAGAAAQNLLLLAVDAGLGACLFGLFDHETDVARAFGVPGDRRLVATVAIGTPRPDEPGRSQRRQRPPIHDIVHRGTWNAGGAPSAAP